MARGFEVPTAVELATSRSYTLVLMVHSQVFESRAAGDIDAMAKKWLGRPAGDLPQ